MKADSKTLEKLFLIFLGILFVYYLFLASNTPFLGEDESIYHYEGQLLSQSKYPSFFATGNPNVIPIFMPLFYASLFSILGSSLALAKISSTFLGFLTILLVYLIGKKINIYVGIFASGVLLSIVLFTHYMLIAYVDVPIAFFSALFTYALLKMDSFKKAMLTGIILALSFYAKDSGFFLFTVLISYAALLYVKEKNTKYLKLSLVAAVISIILFVPFLVRNIYYFKYPYSLAFNIFFPNLTSSSISSSFLPQLSNLFDFAGAFGWIALVLAVLGSAYVAFNPEKFKHKEAFLSLFILLLFIVVYTIGYFSGKVILAESRYLLILFPQMSLLGGYFMWSIKEKSKYSMIILIPIFLFGFYSSISIANSTASSTRYPSNYIEALQWIKSNTQENSIIFTAYGGSVRYYADRDIVWSSIKEFPQLMTTQNSTYIYDVLKNSNVSYILIWRSIISQDYIIPGSNIAGVFTYNFLNTVSSDSKHFNSTYQNQDNVIFKLL